MPESFADFFQHHNLFKHQTMSSKDTSAPMEISEGGGATENKYDRQLRLWQMHGQLALLNARVLVLSSGPVATEFLKNMILPGTGKQGVDLDGKKMIVNPYYLPDLVNGLLSENSVSLEYLFEYKNQNNIELLREYKKLLKEWLIPLHNEFNPLDSFLYEENIQVLESEHIGNINI